jgi:hypothetical protein
MPMNIGQGLSDRDVAILCFAAWLHLGAALLSDLSREKPRQTPKCARDLNFYWQNTVVNGQCWVGVPYT